MGALGLLHDLLPTSPRVAHAYFQGERVEHIQSWEINNIWGLELSCNKPSLHEPNTGELSFLYAYGSEDMNSHPEQDGSGSGVIGLVGDPSLAGMGGRGSGL